MSEKWGILWLCREEKQEEADGPKYRDRAKERREDQNPDYEATELGSFHAVAPPGTVDIRAADAHKLSIEKSKYLGGSWSSSFMYFKGLFRYRFYFAETENLLLKAKS